MLHELFNQQKQYIAKHKQIPLLERKKILRNLQQLLLQQRQALLDAAYQDYKRVAAEVVLSELSYIDQELTCALQHLEAFHERKYVKLSWLEFGAKAYTIREPYGVVLIIAPWNYPYLLTLVPTIHALATGNTVIIKPSEFCPAQSAVLEKLIWQLEQPTYVVVQQGDAYVAQQLLELPFDYIFFTGSTAVGKKVYQKAAEQLIPVTLELGGKCPAIVTQHADLQQAAEKIIWGKFFNAGQTCVAPDYVVVHQSCYEQFILACVATLKKFYGDDPKHSPAYARIVNSAHTERLEKLLATTQGTQIIGGEIDLSTNYCAPTLMQNVTFDDALMQEEIFGPLLPILSYTNLEQLMPSVRRIGAPLSVYVFSLVQRDFEYIKKYVQAGGFVKNDVLTPANNTQLPFGGVAASGFGRYHGIYGFETFSRPTVVYERTRSWFTKFAYPPYRSIFLRWLFSIK